MRSKTRTRMHRRGERRTSCHAQRQRAQMLNPSRNVIPATFHMPVLCLCKVPTCLVGAWGGAKPLVGNALDLRCNTPAFLA